MTNNDMIENIVKETLVDNDMQDTKENRLAIMIALHDGWNDNIESSIESSILLCHIVLAISHLRMRIRLNLN